MKVAVSVTKIFDVEDMTLAQLSSKMQDDADEDYIDWYDLEVEQEIWSYAVIEQ